MQKIFDLSESPTVYFQIAGKGKVTSEIYSFLRMYENFNKLLAACFCGHVLCVMWVAAVWRRGQA